jgi:hypothetical protein
MNRKAESELDRLYGLPVEEFTQARNDAAKQARAEDRQAAEVIAKARRPTQAAWAVNQLARNEPKQVQALLRTADRLRAAESPRTLRKAMRDQREALDTLIRTAREQHGLGQPLLDRMRDTLHAATVDNEARGLLELGRFTKEQQAVGFGPLPAPQRHRASSPRGAERRRRDRRTAKRELASSSERARSAKAELEEAVAAAQDAKAAVEAAQTRLARAERDEAQARLKVDKAG